MWICLENNKRENSYQRVYYTKNNSGLKMIIDKKVDNEIKNCEIFNKQI